MTLVPNLTPSRSDPQHWLRLIGHVGAQLRRMRELVGLSQERLAQVAGLSQGAVSRTERGRGLQTPLVTYGKLVTTLARELEALGPAVSVELVAFLTAVRTVDPVPEAPLVGDPLLRTLLGAYQTLDRPEREALVGLVLPLAAFMHQARDRGPR